MRLQVSFPEQEAAALRRELRAARERQFTKDPAVRLGALARAAGMNLPTADIEQMIAESGYLVDLP